MADIEEAEILFERRGAVGLVTLNRPRALNALTLAMLGAMQAQLEAWAAKAQQARKLDDAKTLRASAEEVAREVRRRQTVLRGAGRLK